MSFESSYQNGGGIGRKGGAASFSNSANASSVTNNVELINSNVAKLQKYSNMLGSSKDSRQVRDQLTQLVSSTREIATSTQRMFKDWEKSPDTSGSTRQQRMRLMGEFQKSGQRFGDLARLCAEKERQYPIMDQLDSKPEGSSMIYGDALMDPGIGKHQEEQQRLISSQYTQQMEFENAQYMERDESLKNLEKSVTDLNSLFIDVAQLVRDAQPMIDSIESSVESSVQTTSRAHAELGSASSSQKSARTKMCWLLLILILILGVIAVVIVFKIAF